MEDPFIENKPSAILKQDREEDIEEHVKRLEMNGAFVDLIRDKRFYGLFQSRNKSD